MFDCMQYPVSPPKIVAIAKAKNVTPTTAFADPTLPGPPPKYGQDLTFGVGGVAPGGYSVGSTEADLKSKMAELLDIFALDDKTGMAKRLFDKFLAKQTRISYFDDADLNAAAAAHENVAAFRDAALGAPGYFDELGSLYRGKPPPPGKTRIHQALQAAGWDVTKLHAPTDLGPPAFNEGSKFFGTKDWGNGLGLMIDGVQYAYVIASHYHYDKSHSFFDCDGYSIHLKFIFYDVFGLDDEDLKTYGASSDSRFWHSAAAIGITAWWQLQHQFGYAPLVTRIILEDSYEVPII